MERARPTVGDWEVWGFRVPGYCVKVKVPHIGFAPFSESCLQPILTFKDDDGRAHQKWLKWLERQQG